MRRPLSIFALSLVLLAGTWTWYVIAYVGDEEDPPGWLLAIWFVGLGLLAISLVWAIVHPVRALGRVVVQVRRDASRRGGPPQSS
jgi:hypothetical protein